MVLTPGPPGTLLARNQIGARARATPRLWFALADRDDLFSVVYPAISRDAGRTWRVDGPCLYYSAAQGPNVTSSIGARAPGSAYAWGARGTIVKATGDAGRRWFVTGLPGEAVGVGYRGRSLRALVCGAASRVFAYRSIDDGRTWRLSGVARRARRSSWC
jgi:hypothetical protein